MSYKSEFPDYDGEFYLPDGWVDNSWHNDTMPRAILEVGDAIYSIWQDFVNVSNREIIDRKRYIFTIEVGYNTVFSYETNKLSKIKKLVKGVVI